MISTTLSDFRKEMKTYLDKVTDEHESIVINRGKDKGVVLLSMEEYSALQNYAAEPDHWDTLTAEEKVSIERGLADVEAGRVTPHEEVMKKMRDYVKSKVV